MQPGDSEHEEAELAAGLLSLYSIAMWNKSPELSSQTNVVLESNLEACVIVSTTNV
jgi:hypothetical protein